VLWSLKGILEQALGNATSTMRRFVIEPCERQQLWCGTNDLINRILGITKYLGLASWLGVITVLGSSIALMNIMIVSVTERTRNRRSESFRAKKTTIAIQFFMRPY
jgi:putative ABC transport system permease protein